MKRMHVKRKWIAILVVVFFAALCSGKKDTAAGAQKQPVQTQPVQTPAVVNPESGKTAVKVTFIELGSVRCIPCKMMQPVMDDIRKEYAGQVDVVFHDVWTPEGQPYGEKYGIQAIPTQVFLDSEGKEYHRHTGFFPKEELVKILQMKGVK